MLSKLIRPRTPVSHDNAAFVRLAYRLVLQREPDPEGLQSYTKQMNAQRLSPLGLLQNLHNSEEYQRRQAENDYRQDQAMAAYLTETVLKDSAEFEKGVFLSPPAYQQAWEAIFRRKSDLIIGQKDYGELHKQRFYELFNAVMGLVAQLPAPKIIEFGVSEFSALYQRFIPQARLHTVDRPTTPDYIGFTPSVSKRVSGCQEHFEIDLNQPAAISTHLAAQHGSYDLVVFTEILEHLLVNPAELLAQLIALLNEQGYLYLTTPNFYRRQNLQLIESRHNPQPTYPGDRANWDAHFHHREYCLKELLAIIEQAGGKTARFYFSACWDGEAADAMPADQRSNLVFVIQKR